MKKSMIEILEQNELIDKLNDSGYADLVDIFLSNESLIFTKSGRINKSGACRVLKCKTKQLEKMLAECRRILGEDNVD